MSKLGTAQSVKYVKRPSSDGAKDVRPAKTSGSNKPRQPTPYQTNGCK